MLHLLYSAHGILNFLLRDIEFHCHYHCCHKVAYVAFAHELGLQVDALAASLYCERCASRTVLNILGAIVALIFIAHAVTHTFHIGYFAISHIGEVVVNHSKTVGRKGVYEFKLGALHILDALKRLKVLCAYRSHNAHLGMHYVAYFLYVAYVFCTHFHYEEVVVGLHHLTHGSHHAHGGVVATGGHQH